MNSIRWMGTTCLALALGGVLGASLVETPPCPPIPSPAQFVKKEIPSNVEAILDTQIKKDRGMGLAVEYANQSWNFEALDNQEVWVVTLRRGYNTYESYSFKVNKEGKVLDVR